jgi:hypothetical protein
MLQANIVDDYYTDVKPHQSVLPYSDTPTLHWSAAETMRAVRSTWGCWAGRSMCLISGWTGDGGEQILHCHQLFAFCD